MFTYVEVEVMIKKWKMLYYMGTVKRNKPKEDLET